MKKKSMGGLLNSQYRLRKIIGILGICLPIIILFLNKNMLASISHSYYTPASIFFIGILFSFGIVLISYKGYPPNPAKKERFSDDLLTTLAGISILITVIIPTKCTGSGQELLFCGDGYLFGHTDQIKNNIHLLSAAVFLFILGLMCVKRFTKNKNPKLKFKNRTYRICGYVVWACIGSLIVIFALEKFLKINFNEYLNAYTFILESIAVWAFGIAWLIKGRVDKYFTFLFSMKIN